MVREPVSISDMAVILVNFRSPDDTIECLASIFAGSVRPHVIVADNQSNDGSVERIASWARGDLDAPVANAVHANPAYDALARPIAFDVLHPGERPPETLKSLTLMHTGGNLGFAGGNNRGLELAQRFEAIRYFWLLNNDTIVDRIAVEKLRDTFVGNPDLGMIGTPIRLYHQPDRYQLLNGMTFNKWTGAAKGVAAGMPVSQSMRAQEVLARTDFVCGASMAVTRAFLEQIGPLEEKFFLYYEEIDWALRARNLHKTGYAEEAVVFHKEGASAGSASQLSNRARSPLSEFHHIRSKMIFVRKHLPFLFPLYCIQNCVILLRRVLRGQPEQSRAVARAMFGLDSIPK